LKLVVAEFARNKGVGYQLLDFAVNYSSTRGVQNCFLELRASNEAARLLYEKRGLLLWWGHVRTTTKSRLKMLF